jgi:hypothetical protein
MKESKSLFKNKNLTTFLKHYVVSNEEREKDSAPMRQELIHFSKFIQKNKNQYMQFKKHWLKSIQSWPAEDKDLNEMEGKLLFDKDCDMDLLKKDFLQKSRGDINFEWKLKNSLTALIGGIILSIVFSIIIGCAIGFGIGLPFPFGLGLSLSLASSIVVGVTGGLVLGAVSGSTFGLGLGVGANLFFKPPKLIELDNIVNESPLVFEK